MPYYHPKRRKVYGTEQVGANHEILTTTEYARKHAYTRDAVAKQCQCKKLRAYKNSGRWLIVDKTISTSRNLEQ